MGALISLSLFCIFAGLMIPLFLYSKINSEKLKNLSKGYYFFCPFLIGFVAFDSNHSLELNIWFCALSMIFILGLGFLEKKRSAVAHADYKKFVKFIALIFAVSPTVIASIALMMALVMGKHEAGFMTVGISLNLLKLTLAPAVVFYACFMISSTMKFYRSTEPISTETPSTSESPPQSPHVQ